MYYNLIILSTLVNQNSFVRIIVDTSCLCYRLCNPIYAIKQNLEYIKIRPLQLEAFDGEKARRPILEVAIIDINLEGYKEQIQFYITLLGGYNMFLGMPQIKKRNIEIN